MEKQLRRYIFPNVLAMVGTCCYVLADTFFISIAQGANGITALNLVLPVYAFIYAIGSMIGVGSATRYALLVESDPTEAKKYFSNAFWWSILIGLPLIAVGIFLPGELLALLGADETILAVGTNYTRIFLCFSPFFMVNYTFTSFARNDNAPRLAMMATLLSGLFNIVFDYLFMFPMGLGMEGAALATGVSPIVSISICMIHYLSKENTIVFFPGLPSLRRLLSGCQLGIVALMGEVSNGITTLVFNVLLLQLGGNIAVAAYGVVANIALVGFALFNGVSLGLQPVASTAHSRGDRSGELAIYKSARSIALGIAVVLIAAVVGLAPELVALFNSEGSRELAALAEPGLRLYFAGFLIGAVNFVKAGFYSATDKVAASSLIAVSRGIVAISLMAVVLSRLLGIVGVWLAFPASELATWLLSLLVKPGRSFRR